MNGKQKTLFDAIVGRGIDPRSLPRGTLTICDGLCCWPCYDSNGAEVAAKSRDLSLTRDSCRCHGNVAETVLANPTALALLRGERSEVAYTIVVEGEIDYLVWASRTWLSEVAVFGVSSGMWSQQVANKIPAGTAIFIRVHQDESGERFATNIAATLGCRVNLDDREVSLIWRLADGDARDEQERLDDGDLSANPGLGCSPITPSAPDPDDWYNLYSEEDDSAAPVGSTPAHPEFTFDLTTGEIIGGPSPLRVPKIDLSNYRRVRKPIDPTRLAEIRVEAWFNSAIEQCADEIRATGKGERNTKLNAVAYHLSRRLHLSGAPSETYLKRRLAAAALDCGLQKRETLRTIRSGIEAGLKQPLDIDLAEQPGR